MEIIGLQEPLGVSRDFLLFHVSPLLKTFPPPGVQLWQIQCVVMSGSRKREISHCYLILILVLYNKVSQ
jgi:hypothetical protein